MQQNQKSHLFHFTHSSSLSKPGTDISHNYITWGNLWDFRQLSPEPQWTLWNFFPIYAAATPHTAGATWCRGKERSTMDLQNERRLSRGLGLIYLFNFSVPYVEVPQRVARVHLGAFQRHHDVPVLLAVLRGPVLVTFPLNDTTGEQGWRLSDVSPFGSDSTCDGCEPTLPFSTRFVIMMMIPVFCSHTILQKSSNVDLRGPWAAIYALGRL